MKLAGKSLLNPLLITNSTSKKATKTLPNFIQKLNNSLSISSENLL